MGGVHMTTRWVVREGTARGEGLYMGTPSPPWLWTGDRRNEAFYFGSLRLAREVATIVTGRVVRLRPRAVEESRHARFIRAGFAVEAAPDAMAAARVLADAIDLEADPGHADVFEGHLRNIAAALTRFASSAVAASRAEGSEAVRRWRMLNTKEEREHVINSMTAACGCGNCEEAEAVLREAAGEDVSRG